MRQRILAVACAAMAAGLSGCATARVIKSDSMSVVVAVPDQTNDWPFRYKDDHRPTVAGRAKGALLSV